MNTTPVASPASVCHPRGARVRGPCVVAESLICHQQTAASAPSRNEKSLGDARSGYSHRLLGVRHRSRHACGRCVVAPWQAGGHGPKTHVDRGFPAPYTFQAAIASAAMLFCLRCRFGWSDQQAGGSLEEPVTHEEDLSAQEAEPEDEPRLLYAHGHPRRTECPGPEA